MDHPLVPEGFDKETVYDGPDVTGVCARKGQYHLEEVWMTIYRLKLQKPDTDETAESYFARNLNHAN